MAKKRGRSKASSEEEVPAEEEEMHDEQENVVKSSEDGEKPPKKKNKKSKSKSKETSEDASDPKRSRNNALAFESVKPPLSKGVLQFLENQKFHTMTPVQAAAIPLFLSHKDVAVQACTGSGKTLSFLIPIVEMILRRQSPLKKSQVGAIVLSPTRELAHQTYTVAQSLCEAVNMTPPLLVVGGGSGSGSGSSAVNHRPVTADLEAFQKTNPKILICTPGRLEDILNRYIAIDVSELDCLVLDEADVLMKMGFLVSLTNILSKLPRMRRTGLFSATQVGLKEWTHRAGLRNPVWVNVAVTSNSQDQTSRDQATPASLENYYIVPPLVEKFSRLAAFLQSHLNEKIIVFFMTCACVEFYGTALQQLLPDQYIELLHGKLVQKRREKAMERFRNCANLEQDDDDDDNNKANEGSVLCCTDVAARGLDVTDVHWVVQFDAPQDPAFFIHRAGRAARAGRKGSNLVFLTPKEESYVDLLRMRKVPLSPLPSTEVCAPPEDTEEKEKEKSKEQQKKKSKGNDVVIATEGEPPKTRIIKSASDPNLQMPDMLPKLRDIVLKDRDMLEKGTKAFTSYIRAYKEHQCAFIFRFASLDLGLLATSFCLLRLPKMPEMRDVLAKNNGKLPNFESAGPEVDIYKIPYLDKAREAARQKRLQAELAAGGKNAKQIKAEQRKADKLQREKEQRKVAIEKGRNPDKKRGKNAQMMDEWDDLAKEERLYKKLRRGKISQEEFDEQMYGGNKKGKKAIASYL